MTDEKNCQNCNKTTDLYPRMMPRLPLSNPIRWIIVCDECYFTSPFFCKKHQTFHRIFDETASHCCSSCVNDEIIKKGKLYYRNVLLMIEERFTEREFRRLKYAISERWGGFPKILTEHSFCYNRPVADVVNEILETGSVEVILPNAPLCI